MKHRGLRCFTTYSMWLGNTVVSHRIAPQYILTPVKALGLDVLDVVLEGVLALGPGFEA